ncbi:MAG: glycosyltransferase [Planctomycetes bacterium]|nr:glycosyltransferase [Planctomycetota bacterium]
MSRVLILSDPPGAPTGFGGQAALLAEAVRAAGAEPVALAMGLGAAGDAPEPRTFSGGVRGWRIPYCPTPATLEFIFRAERPDAVVAAAELWTYETLSCIDPASLRRVLAWVAMDCPYLPEPIVARLAAFGRVVAMAEYGEDCLAPVRAAGGRLARIPHGVRPEFETRVSRDDITARRRAHGLDDSFVALSVGRNQVRKGHAYLLDAWSRFVADLPPGHAERVRLFLHTEQVPLPFADVADRRLQAALDAQRGCDLPALIEKHFAAAADTIEFSELGAPPSALRFLYGTADVHVMATHAEGFGVPLAEAQACGRANIAPRHTTIPEIVGGGGTGAAAPGAAPFGWVVPCSGRILQADILEWRDVVDVAAAAGALREAWELWRSGALNAPEAEERRRSWTMSRYGSAPVVAKWAELVRETLAG